MNKCKSATSAKWDWSEKMSGQKSKPNDRSDHTVCLKWTRMSGRKSKPSDRSGHTVCLKWTRMSGKNSKPNDRSDHTVCPKWIQMLGHNGANLMTEVITLYTQN